MIVQQGCCPLCGRRQELWPPYLDPGGPPHEVFIAMIEGFDRRDERLDYDIVCPCGEFGALRSVWLDLEEHLLGEPHAV